MGTSVVGVRRLWSRVGTQRTEAEERRGGHDCRCQAEQRRRRVKLRGWEAEVRVEDPKDGAVSAMDAVRLESWRAGERAILRMLAPVNSAGRPSPAG